jgi:hypothetical protein
LKYIAYLCTAGVWYTHTPNEPSQTLGKFAKANKFVLTLKIFTMQNKHLTNFLRGTDPRSATSDPYGKNQQRTARHRAEALVHYLTSGRYTSFTCDFLCSLYVDKIAKKESVELKKAEKGNMYIYTL